MRRPPENSGLPLCCFQLNIGLLDSTQLFKQRASPHLFLLLAFNNSFVAFNFFYLNLWLLIERLVGQYTLLFIGLTCAVCLFVFVFLHSRLYLFLFSVYAVLCLLSWSSDSIVYNIQVNCILNTMILTKALFEKFFDSRNLISNHSYKCVPMEAYLFTKWIAIASPGVSHPLLSVYIDLHHNSC